MDDRQIIELYFNRVERAIEETSRKYGKLCFYIANNILHNMQDSEECVNDTYMNIWNLIPPEKPINFSAYICKIARNVSLKKLEYYTAQKRSMYDLVPLEELDEILSGHHDADLDMSIEEIGGMISEFLKSEKDDARNVFIRRYFFFDSISDISSRYGFSKAKIKNMLYRTRNRLKIYLQNEEIDV